MSRDPEEGITHRPNTLHKYLYAGGDPVNIVDPTGHMFDTATILFKILTVQIALLMVEVGVIEVMECVSEMIKSATPNSTHTVDKARKGPCSFDHDHWPDQMPPSRQPAPRWPGVGDTGEAP